MSELRTLIVDDEPAAVRRLERLCADIAGVTVVGSTTDGLAALDILERTQIDLTLLDIEMPGLSGMELAEHLAKLPHKPMVIFATAFENFAIAAFSVDAIGYLLKPVDPALLRTAVDRALNRMASGFDTPHPGAIFWAPHRGQLLKLESSAIDCITGEGDYARLHLGEKSYLISERLYAIEERLRSSHFARIHRSALINIDHIVALEQHPNGWTVRLKGGKCIAIGRTFLASLRQRLNVQK